MLADIPGNEILHRILIDGFTSDNEIEKAIEITDRAIEANPQSQQFYRIKARFWFNPAICSPWSSIFAA